MHAEWQQMKNYNYRENLATFTGIRELYPSTETQMAQMESTLCLHSDAHEREITVNGVDDTVNYRHCTLTPSLGPEMARIK